MTGWYLMKTAGRFSIMASFCKLFLKQVKHMTHENENEWTDLEWRPDYLLPEDLMAFSGDYPPWEERAVQEVNAIIKDAWDWSRKEAPVLESLDNLREMREEDLAHPLSNEHAAQMRVFRAGKSFNGIRYYEVNYKPAEHVNKSRSNGFSWNFSHFLLIAIDMIEKEIHFTTYHVTY